MKKIANAVVLLGAIIAHPVMAQDITGDVAPYLVITPPAQFVIDGNGGMTPSAEIGIRNETEFFLTDELELMPSDWVGRYVLMIQGADSDGNTVTKRIPVNVDPKSVNLATSAGGTVGIPALGREFSDLSGLPPLTTYPMELNDGSLVLGSHEVVVSSHPSSTIPLLVNGIQVDQGARRVSIGELDFTANNGRIRLPVRVLEDGQVGEARLLLQVVGVPGAPVVDVTVDAWLPEIALDTKSWDRVQGFDQLTITAVDSTRSCYMTGERMTAQAADIIRSPSCFVEWLTVPEGLQSDGVSIKGRLKSADMQQVVGYQVSFFDHNGQKIIIHQEEKTLNVTAAAGQIALAFDRLLPTYITKVERAEFGLTVDKGPACNLFTTATAAKNSSASGTLGCHVEWLAIPAGLQQDPSSTAPLLSGILESASNNVVRWRVSAVMSDGTVLPITEQAKPVPAAEPAAPAIALSGLDTVTTIDGRTVLVADGQEYLSIRVDAANLAYSVRVSRDGQLLEQRTYSKTGTGPTMRSTFSVTHEPKRTWEETEYEIEVSYAAAASYADACASGTAEEWACSVKLARSAFQVPSSGIEALVEVPGREGLSNTPINVTAGIQNRGADGEFDSGTWGEWQVRIVRWLDRETYEALTEFRPLTSATEMFTVNPEASAGDNLRLATEMVLVSKIEGYERTELSRTETMRIHYAGVIEAALTARNEAGEAPFLARLEAELTTRDHRYSLGSVSWEMSTDGEVWNPVDTSRSYSTRFNHTVDQGESWFRATIVNKYNESAVFTTEPIKISAYQVPDVTLEAPRRVFVGIPGTFTVRASVDGVELAEDQFVVQWSDTGEEGTWETGSATKLIQRDTADYVRVHARARLAAAPDLEGAWEEARNRISVVAEKAPRVRIAGDKRAEFGKSYTYTAQVTEPYSGMNVDVQGHWLLPDGSEVEGTSLNWTPSQADLDAGAATLTYVAWIDGVSGTEMRESLAVSIWDYVWPEFRVVVYGGGEYSPADVQLRVEPLGLTKLSTLGNITFAWEYPVEAFTLDRNNGDRLFLRNIKPGMHTIKVTVANAGRGLSSVLEQEVETLTPPSWSGEIDVYGDNQYMREPLEVRLRASVEGGHPRDRVETWTWRIGGHEQTVDSSYIRTVLNAGTYPIEATGQTTFGDVVSLHGSVTVKANQAPNCAITSSDGGYYWSFSANCQDPDGNIREHRWTVNGRVASSTASRMSVTKSDIPPQVSVMGIDDAGTESPVASWTGSDS